LGLWQVRQAFNSLLANVGTMAEWAQDVVVQAQKRRQQWAQKRRQQ